MIIDFEGLNKKSPSLLNGGLLTRSLWQKFFLSKSARKEGCNVLLIPGGNYSGNFFPVVTMCRNMLPFEWKELFRYGISFLTIKLLLLRLFQSNSFKRSNGIIFLTEHAKKRIIQIIGTLSGSPKVIPHGLNQIFNNRPKIQKSISYYDIKHPFKIIYVSIIDEYKHQCSIIEAISNLRNQNKWPITLDLIGPHYKPSLKKLYKNILKFDKNNDWVHYHGKVQYGQLPSFYQNSDIAVFASTCENLPNILIEMMASGLPIACSETQPMPEILKTSGVYFNSENPKSISDSITKLIESKELRSKLAESSYNLSESYSWDKSTNETLQFLKKVSDDFYKNK